MTHTKNEVLKLALEALERATRYGAGGFEDAKDAIKQALAAPTVQEPVARVIDDGTPEGATEWIPFVNRVEPLKTGDLLYTNPPAAQPAIPDAITDNSESPEYRAGWNECREVMAGMLRGKP